MRARASSISVDENIVEQFRDDTILDDNKLRKDLIDFEKEELYLFALDVGQGNCIVLRRKK